MKSLYPIGLLFAIFFMSSCATYPLYYDDKPKSTGMLFEVEVVISPVTQYEFDKIIKKTKKSNGYEIINHKMESNKAILVYKINSLNHYYTLMRALDNLENEYDSYESITMLSNRKKYTQFHFTKGSSAATNAKYEIIEIFDPQTAATIGGLNILVSFRGQAIFNGEGLDLSEASNGKISIVDSQGNKIDVYLREDNNWYVEVSGILQGEEIQKDILLEVFK